MGTHESFGVVYSFRLEVIIKKMSGGATDNGVLIRGLHFTSGFGK